MDHQATTTRRGALTAIGAAAAGGMLGCATSGARAAVLTGQDLGYDASSGRYTLPPLPYAEDALEPHIDATTMMIHHDRHHAGYVRGLNKALDELERIRNGADAGLVKHWSRELSFHGSGHVNHTLFWLGMAPADRSGEPGSALMRRVEQDFGSYEQFLAHFKAASGAVEGSGWGWLVWEPVAGRLLVLQGEKQQDLMLTGVIPLLGVDVWEHAYYLKYQNRRADYIDAFLRVVNWSEIDRRFAAATA